MWYGYRARRSDYKKRRKKLSKEEAQAKNVRETVIHREERAKSRIRKSKATAKGKKKTKIRRDKERGRGLERGEETWRREITE